MRWLYQRWMAGRSYEDQFGKRLLAAVDASSVVWDIGANVGLYSSQCLEHGAREVVCFEPAPDAVHALRTRFAGNSRVRILPVALAAATGTAEFLASGAEPTNRLGSNPGDNAAGTALQVPIWRGADLLREHGLTPPTVMKIDVEGYEWEVLRGCEQLLRRRELRKVFVEVHFSLLHERGLDEAPGAIDALLTDAGLTVRWVDLSHIEASRD